MLLTVAAGGATLVAGRQALAQAVFEDNPFQLGVAAGDPLPDGFVIWTRLAPKPLEPDHGMPSQSLPVSWEVATEAGFGDSVVQSGGDGQDQRGDQQEFLTASPQLKFRNSQRGYVVCEVTPERWRTDVKVLDQIQDGDGVLSTRMSMAIEAGDARLVPA